MGALYLNLPDFLLVADLGNSTNLHLNLTNLSDLAGVWFKLPIPTRDRLYLNGTTRGEFEAELYRAYYAGIDRLGGVVSVFADDPKPKRGRPKKEKKGA